LIHCSKRGLNTYDLAITADISHGAFRLWHLILKFREKNTGVAWACPDAHTLCAILKCTPESFGRWRLELEDALLLKVENICGPTRKRWQYTILDGTGENSAWASMVAIRVGTPTDGKHPPSRRNNPPSPTGGKSPARRTGKSDCDGGPKPTPSNPLIREEGGASPALPDVRASERRSDSISDGGQSAGDPKKVESTGISIFEMMRRAIKD
jgi:hypothetical protein